jgi:hypothetical protein
VVRCGCLIGKNRLFLRVFRSVNGVIFKSLGLFRLIIVGLFGVGLGV